MKRFEELLNLDTWVDTPENLGDLLQKFAKDLGKTSEANRKILRNEINLKLKKLQDKLLTLADPTTDEYTLTEDKISHYMFMLYIIDVKGLPKS